MRRRERGVLTRASARATCSCDSPTSACASSSATSRSSCARSSLSAGSAARRREQARRRAAISFCCCNKSTQTRGARELRHEGALNEWMWYRRAASRVWARVWRGRVRLDERRDDTRRVRPQRRHCGLRRDQTPSPRLPRVVPARPIGFHCIVSGDERWRADAVTSTYLCARAARVLAKAVNKRCRSATNLSRFADCINHTM